MPDRIWVAMTSENLDGEVASRFARAPFFGELAVENDEMGSSGIHRNPYIDADHAGPQTVEWVARARPRAVIAGQYGWRALEALREADVEVVEVADGPVREAVASYLRGEARTRSHDEEPTRLFRRGQGRRHRRRGKRQRTP